jgi:hypothetical protein
VRLEPLYRATFTTPEAWSVELIGPAGTEGQSFLIAEGRADGRLSARFRAANYPRRRIDNTLVPEFHGVLETDEARPCSSRGTATHEPATAARASWSAASRTSPTTSAIAG